MVSEGRQDVSAGGYRWPAFDSSDDYDRLVGVLDVEYERGMIARELKSNSSSEVSDVFVDYDCMDKDHRSTDYNFFFADGAAINAK